MGGVYSANWAGWVWRLYGKARLRCDNHAHRWPGSGRNGGYRRSFERDARFLGAPIVQYSAGPVGMAPCLVVFMASCWCVGISPNGDGDDILKLMKIRAFLETGAWFDQSIPGILQPEPFFSHWPRLLDLPYALATWLLAPFVGRDTALAVATFAVPLLLLLPATALLRRIIAGLGFERLDMAFLLALFLATRTFFEFAPNRIDYHNTQILFLLAVITLTFVRSTRASMASGAITALAIATSVEFALFFALVMAIYVAEYIRDDEGSRLRLAAFGAGLATVAILAYPLAIPPGSYGRVACDSYSTPHLLALVLAGAAFIAAAGIGRQESSRHSFGQSPSPFRASPRWPCSRCCFPNASGAPMPGSTPTCAMSSLVTSSRNAVSPQCPDFVLSGRMVGAAIMFIGAAAPAVIAVAGRFRDRNLLVIRPVRPARSRAVLALISAASATCLYWLGRASSLCFRPSCPASALRERCWLAVSAACCRHRPRYVAPGLLVAAGVVAFHL